MPVFNEKSPPEIVVVGSTMIDMIAYSQKIPSAGETVIGDSFSLGFGGKGANQAVMASRLGAKVSMVNTLGDDVFGDTTIKNFHDQGIDTTFIARVSGASGVAPIWVEPSGTNRIICVPGANNAMTPQQAEDAISALPNAQVVIGQLEIPQAVTSAAFRKARSMGITTILNPAPFAPLTPELISLCDWIIPNETEFAGLNPDGKQPDNEVEISKVAKLLGCNFVVTLGEKGAAYTDSNGKIIYVLAPKVKAVDSTGAGDSFVGAFAFGIASGFEIEESVRLGCACASDSVTRKGTQSSYPSKAEAAQLLKNLF
ncbi:MAG: ribokinase [Candidatus Nanopelagicaceae bacterium]|nr:ribokinase [Candidatus Nanopelagicaceae bacterium]